MNTVALLFAPFIPSLRRRSRAEASLRRRSQRVLKCLLVGVILLLFGEAPSAARDGKPPQVGVLLAGTPDYPSLKGFLHVVTFGETTTAIAVKAIRATPIVFIHAIDPVGMGFVKSLAHPGTKVTGIISYSGFELQAKRLEMLKEVVPHLRRVAVVARGEPHHARSLAAVRTAAAQLGRTLLEKPVTFAAEAEQAVASVSRDTADGIFVICSFLFNPVFKKMATHRDRILKGARPEDLSVEAPMEFNLIINLKTTNALGLTIRPSVLLRADEVIR